MGHLHVYVKDVATGWQNIITVYGSFFPAFVRNFKEFSLTFRSILLQTRSIYFIVKSMI